VENEVLETFQGLKAYFWLNECSQYRSSKNEIFLLLIKELKKTICFPVEVKIRDEYPQLIVMALTSDRLVYEKYFKCFQIFKL
jgi:hypothetical protein